MLKSPIKLFANRINLYILKLKLDSIALWFATRHPETSLLVKSFIWFVVAYALSPIDLIPDFIPLFGLLDDLILLAITVNFAVRLIPIRVLDRCRALAQQWFDKQKKHPTVFYGVFIIIFIWICLALIIYDYYL